MHHDLDRWLARALSIAEDTGADPELRGQLAAALGEVAAVQARTDALTRRERELAALYDTARDLAALRDLDVLLTAIVRRARTLLGTDVAYLTLRDPERGAAAGEELLGELVLTGADELDGAAVRTVERAAVVTALVLLVRRIAVAAEEQVRGELLVDLLIEPGRDPASVADRADRLAVSLVEPHCLVVATAALPRERLAVAAARLARTRCGLSAAHLGASVLLLPGVAAGDAARSVSRALATVLGGPVTAGAAGPVRSPAGIPAAYAEAERCRAALIRLGRDGAGADAAELGYVGLLLAERADPAGFVTAALGPVLEYDARRGTELVRTMRAYFAAGQSPARAREELHVHVNTVVQRLERITALLGEGWQSPERVVELQLALRLATLLGYQ